MSSTLAASINLTKLCVGSGILALPFATIKGGLLFSPLGIAVIAICNGISCTMIIRCKKAVEGRSTLYNKLISSTYSRIAYAGAGWFGVYVVDFSVMITLLGVCITYQIAFSSLLKDVISLSHTTLTIVSGILVFPLSCTANIGLLSKYSLLGLVLLMLGILSIFFFGIETYGDTIEYTSQGTIEGARLSYWPASITDLTTYTGVAIFCFGLCSLAFPVEESMSNKSEFNKAVVYCLVFVWLLYTLVGDGLAILYSFDPNGVSSNILQNLPPHSWTALFVRLSMGAVSILTFPLTLVPVSQMIENLVIQNFTAPRSLYIPIADRMPGSGKTTALRDMHTSSSSSSLGLNIDLEDDDSSTSSLYQESSLTFRLTVRLVLVAMCTALAASVPCFGDVISLLGCFTVSTLSFIMPPLLHYQIVTKPCYLSHKSNGGGRYNPYLDQYDYVPSSLQGYFDIALTIFGIVVTIAGTVIQANAVSVMLAQGKCS